ncbi:MAG: transposase [Pigmentiphaga sp.]
MFRAWRAWTYDDFRAYAQIERRGAGAAVRGFHWIGASPGVAPEEKARIVAESFEPGATVSDVARRHALVFIRRRPRQAYFGLLRWISMRLRRLWTPYSVKAMVPPSCCGS